MENEELKETLLYVLHKEFGSGRPNLLGSYDTVTSAGIISLRNNIIYKKRSLMDNILKRPYKIAKVEYFIYFAGNTIAITEEEWNKIFESYRERRLKQLKKLCNNGG